MKGGLAELLNFKQKNRDMNEFVKVPVCEKLSYCFGDPALTLMYTMTSTLLIYFYTNVVGKTGHFTGFFALNNACNMLYCLSNQQRKGAQLWL